MIDRILLGDFLSDVAKHLGRATTEEELDEWVAEILGPGPRPRDLGEVGESVKLLVKTWVEGMGPGD